MRLWGATCLLLSAACAFPQEGKDCGGNRRCAIAALVRDSQHLQESGDLPGAESALRSALKLDGRSAAVLHRLGAVLAAQKRYTAAITYFREAAGIEPANPEHPVALALAMYDNGDGAGAIELLAATVKAQPRSALAQANLGTLYARERRYEQAEEHLRSALVLEPSNDVVRLSLAKTLIGVGRQSEALPLLNELLDRKPVHAEGRFLRGMVYRRTGEYDRAAGDLRLAVQENPRDYPSQYNYGFVLARIGKLGEAREHLEIARRLHPDSEEAQFQLAGVLRRLNQKETARKELAEFEARKKQHLQESMAGTTASRANQALIDGDLRAAIEGYRKALQLDPSNAKTYYNLALAQSKLGDSRSAMASLEKSVSLDGSFAPARNQLGLTYMAERRTRDAESQFQAALSSDPQCAECQNNLGVLSAQLGDSRRAESLFREALENRPGYVEARVNLAVMLAGREEFAEARKQLEQAIAADPNHVKALTALGMLQGRTNDAGAVDTLRRVAQLTPGSAEAHLNLGIALADQNQLEAALAEFSEAVRLAGSAAAPHYNKGRLLVQLRRYAAAIPELQEACRLDPQTADPFYRLGIAQRELHRYAAAAASFRRALELNPRNADAAYLLGQSLQASGKTQEALQAWKRALQIDPNHSRALYSLFRTISKTNPAEAARYRSTLKKQQQEKGATERARTLSNFGLAAAKSGNWKQAIAQLREAIQVCGDCPSRAVLHKNLGLTQCRAGDLDGGEKELQLALQELPNDPEILKALTMLEELKRSSH